MTLVLWDKPETPICPEPHPEGNRELWPVLDRRTSMNAISEDHDTPIWFCPRSRYTVHQDRRQMIRLHRLLRPAESAINNPIPSTDEHAVYVNEDSIILIDRGQNRGSTIRLSGEPQNLLVTETPDEVIEEIRLAQSTSEEHR